MLLIEEYGIQTQEGVYSLKQSPQVWFEKFSRVISIHSSSFSSSVILATYVDDIMLTWSDVDGIEKVEDYFKAQFVIKT